nr:hypothetical protein [uncultured Oscillibacter sp.]
MIQKKTINFEEELVSKIEKMAKEAERDFSGQVRWIIKEYIRLKEGG